MYCPLITDNHQNKEFTFMTTAIRNILVDEQGQGLAEYGLILGLIAVLCIAAVIFLSGKIQGLLSQVGSSI
jgi:pilus assembly protein Flp/PilA